jgi:hypothetical protein
MGVLTTYPFPFGIDGMNTPRLMSEDISMFSLVLRAVPSTVRNRVEV